MPPDEFKLSDAEHAEIKECIIAYYTSGLTTVEKPTAVILGGQPGCGKSVLINSYRSSLFPDGNVVIVNGDEIRRFHPRSAEIIMQHEDAYAPITDLDVRDWTSGLFDYALENRFNIIFEGTMRTNVICQTIARLKRLSYRVVIAVMAVGAHTSLFSVCNRYLSEKRLYGYGRKVDFTSHDEAYRNLPITLNGIVDSGLYDKIDLYRRNLFSRHGSTISEALACPENAVETLKHIRNEKIGEREKQILLEEGIALAEGLRGYGESSLADSFVQKFNREVNARST